MATTQATSTAGGVQPAVPGAPQGSGGVERAVRPRLPSRRHGGIQLVEVASHQGELGAALRRAHVAQANVPVGFADATRGGSSTHAGLEIVALALLGRVMQVDHGCSVGVSPHAQKAPSLHRGHWCALG